MSIVKLVLTKHTALSSLVCVCVCVYIQDRDKLVDDKVHNAFNRGLFHWHLEYEKKETLIVTNSTETKNKSKKKLKRDNHNYTQSYPSSLYLCLISDQVRVGEVKK